MLNTIKQYRIFVMFLTLLVCCGLMLTTLYYGIGSVVVRGISMEDSIHDGDKFITNEFAYKLRAPQYNDIVILDAETIPGHELYIKRVVGLPGDELMIRNNELYRNGEKITEPYIKEKMNERDFTTIVPPNHIYVMGDNRNHSSDSRVFDAIDYEEEVKATVLFRLKPFNQHY